MLNGLHPGPDRNGNTVAFIQLTCVGTKKSICCFNERPIGGHLLLSVRGVFSAPPSQDSCNNRNNCSCQAHNKTMLHLLQDKHNLLACRFLPITLWRKGKWNQWVHLLTKINEILSVMLIAFFLSQSIKNSNQYFDCHHLLSAYEPSVFMEPSCRYAGPLQRVHDSSSTSPPPRDKLWKNVTIRSKLFKFSWINARSTV